MRDWLMLHVANDVPLVLLIVLVLASVLLLWWAQGQQDTPSKFNAANMLRDENGKESVLRYTAALGFAWSSWALMKDVLRPEGVDPQIFLIYCVTWSGALVFVKFADKWDGQLPWTK
jgi:hypothetical protein